MLNSWHLWHAGGHHIVHQPCQKTHGKLKTLLPSAMLAMLCLMFPTNNLHIIHGQVRKVMFFVLAISALQQLCITKYSSTLYGQGLGPSCQCVPRENIQFRKLHRKCHFAGNFTGNTIGILGECSALLARYTQCIRQPNLWHCAKLCTLIVKLEIAVWHRARR